MAIKITDFGGTDWNDGEVLNADDLIDTIKVSSTKILETYTGTDFNTYYSSPTTSGSQTNDYELTEITSSELTSREYVEIFITASQSTSAKDGADATANIKIYSKEVGGVYSEKDSYSISSSSGYDQSATNSQFSTYYYLHELTTDEKTNGVIFKIESISSVNRVGAGASAGASVSNKKVVVKLI